MSSLTRWNPRSKLESFEPFRSVEQMMNDMWRNWPGHWLARKEKEGDPVRPAMDVIENDHMVTVCVDLPGLKPEDVHVEVEDHTLIIRGETSDTVEKKGDRYHYRERHYGSFQRSLSLPATVETDQVDAKFDNGVLTIAFPKPEKAEPKQIPIKSSND